MHVLLLASHKATFLRGGGRSDESALLRRAGICFAAYLPSRRILARKYIGDNVLLLKHPTTGRRVRSIFMNSAAVVHLNLGILEKKSVEASKAV
jgi:hypothetical protein